jgi:hypothetical protein
MGQTAVERRLNEDDNVTEAQQKRETDGGNDTELSLHLRAIELFAGRQPTRKITKPCT